MKKIEKPYKKLATPDKSDTLHAMKSVGDKLKILADAAKYDVSCSSSGSRRTAEKGALGNAAHAGICHSWADDGRCISLLKILMTNSCIHDCAYCINRRSNDIERETFTPEEICNLTINFYRRNFIEGLFLSSGIIKTPDFTMERLLHTVSLLRNKEKFNGYIHLKAIPGASQELIDKAAMLVDRISVNIELPTREGLKRLTDKSRSDIIAPMKQIGYNAEQFRQERKKSRKTPLYAPAGQSTQLIVGATEDNDYTIVRLSSELYKRFSMKRVYYSAYVPVSSDKRLPAVYSPRLNREHRLYQADWLMRYYHFQADEIIDTKSPFLPEDIDPKAAWALRNLHLFPVEINFCAYEELLRVPGIGVKSALSIVKARKHQRLTLDHLKMLGVVLKRARFFITCHGRSALKPFKDYSFEQIRYAMMSDRGKSMNQLSLF